jgi:RsiW-degrading membrane proteinase PrsW (M82 family)
MNYPFYFFLAILPSFIWLLFFLRKDVHPESNRMVLKIFFYGMLSALPAILLEMGFSEGLEKLNFSYSWFLFLNVFIGVAFFEEFLKYLVVRGKVFKSPEFDEPPDIMLYMIIAALGFAAFENILILFSSSSAFEAISTTIFRFLGATFLHALCSGTLGYFIALSFYNKKMRWPFLVSGLIMAVSLHGLYNFSIIEIEDNLKFLIPALILFGLAIFTAIGFKRLKKIKSICKIY